MSTLTIAVGRPTIADRLFSRTLALDLVLVAAGAALTSIAAQIAIPLWPVPVTMQTLAVLLVGVSLGAVRGALSMVLYAVLGVVGLPVFSDASSGFSVIAGPTGGYIVGFIFAAGVHRLARPAPVGPQGAAQHPRVPRRHRGCLCVRTSVARLRARYARRAQ